MFCEYIHPKIMPGQIRLITWRMHVCEVFKNILNKITDVMHRLEAGQIAVMKWVTTHNTVYL